MNTITVHEKTCEHPTQNPSTPNPAEPQNSRNTQNAQDARNAQGAQNTQKTVIQIRDLFFAYTKEQKNVLNGINVQIHDGESIAIVGPNGAGKSTLAKHLIGILLAQSGSVLIDGVEVTSRNLQCIRDLVGLVFQDPNDQLFCPTVKDEIEFGLINMKLPRQEIQSRITESAMIMNIRHLLQRPAHHLSGGEKKRVAIAAILAMHPKIMIMDEPTANLDPHNEKVLIDLINSLPCTKIIISHDLPILFQICQRVLIVVKGKILKDCSMKEFMLDHNLILDHGLDFRFKCKCCKAIHPDRFQQG
jgi:energy-coupling factor transporter ATP-binding protein EcfA2